jgi:hypothetical protein
MWTEGGTRCATTTTEETDPTRRKSARA